MCSHVIRTYARFNGGPAENLARDTRPSYREVTEMGMGEGGWWWWERRREIFAGAN